MTKPIKHFTNFADAFAYCRELGKPVIVWVNQTKYKLFPSGKSLKVQQ